MHETVIPVTPSVITAGESQAGRSWKDQNRAWHNVTPPSGMQGMTLRIPSLTQLIRNEAVPERLRAVALKAAAHPAGLRGVMADTLAETEGEQKTDAEVVDDDSKLAQAIEDVVEIQKRLTVESVRVNGVQLTAEDVDDPDFPQPDLEWLGGVMLREIDYDARGVRLGVEPLDAWARFRDFHNCGPDCGSCGALQDEFSTSDLGVV